MYLADIIKSVPECSKINLRASKIQNFSEGAYPQTPRPPYKYARKTRIVMSMAIESWPDHPNFAGSGPD